MNFYTIGEKSIFARFKGNYPKYILTRNDPVQNRNGIIHQNIPDFIRYGIMFQDT